MYNKKTTKIFFKNVIYLIKFLLILFLIQFFKNYVAYFRKNKINIYKLSISVNMQNVNVKKFESNGVSFQS